MNQDDTSFFHFLKINDNQIMRIDYKHKIKSLFLILLYINFYKNNFFFWK